jgi:hypothetical protein
MTIGADELGINRGFNIVIPMSIVSFIDFRIDIAMTPNELGISFVLNCTKTHGKCSDPAPHPPTPQKNPTNMAVFFYSDSCSSVATLKL